MKSSISKMKSYIKTALRDPNLFLLWIKNPNHDALMNRVAERELLNQPFTAFHNDEILQRLIKDSIDYFHISTFFETGTFRGDSLRFVIQQFGDRLEYISCEINKDAYEIASKRITSDPASRKVSEKIHIFNQSSPVVIRQVLQGKLVSNPVLYWLDAHWYTNWPLQDELREILLHPDPAIILIDDFKLPFHSVFNGGFDKCGDVENSLEYIDKILQIEKNLNRYDILFPDYSAKSAGKNAKVQGYIAIYVNLEQIFDQFIKDNPQLRNFRQFDQSMKVRTIQI